jgi:hypothetical protein
MTIKNWKPSIIDGDLPALSDQLWQAARRRDHSHLQSVAGTLTEADRFVERILDLHSLVVDFYFLYPSRALRVWEKAMQR